MKNKHWGYLLFLSCFVVLAGCGLETLLFGLPTAQEHLPPVVEKKTELKGKSSEALVGTVQIVQFNQVLVEGKTDNQGSFLLELPKGMDLNNLEVRIVHGKSLWKTIVPSVEKEKLNDVGNINVETTLLTHLLEAKLAQQGQEIFNFPVLAIQAFQKATALKIQALVSYSPLEKMLGAVMELGKAMEGEPLYFQATRWTEVQAKKTLVQSLLSDAVKVLDYCSDLALGCKDGKEDSTQPFDQLFVSVLQQFELPSCLLSKNLQVVMTVQLSTKALNGNCKTYNPFKHAKRYGGLSCDKCKVFMAAGVHKDSSIQDPQINQLLGNWEPNQKQMYDDGTHGDLKSGDGIWTTTLEVPAPIDTQKKCQNNDECDGLDICWKATCHKPVRIGYKYTFGLQGDVWGGTEEFPGNQRLLEVVDQNGDGLVSIHDSFADEASNKDKVNTLNKEGATGLICFREPTVEQCANPASSHPDCGCKVDQNGDGIPDAREKPFDENNDCKPAGYKVFAKAQPLVLTCE